MVRVAQLVRALDCGSRGRGFDSRRVPLVILKVLTLGCEALFLYVVELSPRL